MLRQGNFWYFLCCFPLSSPQKSPIRQRQMSSFHQHTLPLWPIFIALSTIRLTLPITQRRIYREAFLKRKAPHKSLSRFHFLEGMEVTFTCKWGTEITAIQNRVSVLTRYFLYWWGASYKQNCNDVYFPSSQNCNALLIFNCLHYFWRLREKICLSSSKQEEPSGLYVEEAPGVSICLAPRAVLSLHWHKIRRNMMSRVTIRWYSLLINCKPFV